MNRPGHGGGDVRSLLHSRRGEPSWLYDHVGQDFRREFDLPESACAEITFHEAGPPPDPPRWPRIGPICSFLFLHGGMCFVFLGGLMIFGIGAWLLGFR